MLYPPLEQTLQNLPIELQIEVLHFAEFLAQRKAREEAGIPRPKPSFGFGKYKVEIADDFDAPLEDMKDYM